MLNAEQELALNGILDFLAKPVNNFADCTTLLHGSAGVGFKF